MRKVSVENFLQEHKEIYGNRVSKKSLTSSIEEIFAIPKTKTALYSGAKIYFTCNLTVKKINFGDLTFILDRQGWQNRSKILLKSSMSKYKIKGRRPHGLIAPHCALSPWHAPSKNFYYICLGAYHVPINNYFKTFDYCGVVISLQNLLQNVNEESHYFTSAVYNLYKTCDVCEILIKPFTLITQDNLKEKMLCNACKKQK